MKSNPPLEEEPGVSFHRPISALFVLMALFFLISPLILKLWGRRRPELLVKD